MYNPDTAPYARPLIASARATAATGVIVFECLTRDDNEIEAARHRSGTSRMAGF